MNYEQFYYWLKGYMNGNGDIIFQEIDNAMKQVHLPKVLNTAPFTSQVSSGIVPLNCV